MQVKHQQTTRGGIALQRHTVRLDLTKINAENVPVVISVYVVIEVPQDPIVTIAMVRDMRTQLTGFLTNGNLDKVVNNEP
jgi:hypothetical protein